MLEKFADKINQMFDEDKEMYEKELNTNSYTNNNFKKINKKNDNDNEDEEEDLEKEKTLKEIDLFGEFNDELNIFDKIFLANLNQDFFILKVKDKNSFFSNIPNEGKPELMIAPIDFFNPDNVYNIVKEISYLKEDKLNDEEKDRLIEKLINFIPPKTLAGNVIFIDNFLNLRDKGNQHFNKSLIYFSDLESIIEVKTNLEKQLNTKLEIVKINLIDYQKFFNQYISLQEEPLTKQLDYNFILNNQKERLDLLNYKKEIKQKELEIEQQEEKNLKKEQFKNSFVLDDLEMDSNEISNQNHLTSKLIEKSKEKLKKLNEKLKLLKQ